jgi:hypothetical protein
MPLNVNRRRANAHAPFLISGQSRNEMPITAYQVLTLLSSGDDSKLLKAMDESIEFQGASSGLRRMNAA